VLPAGAHVAIFLNSTKLFMIQGFTSDPVALFAAMGEKHSNPQWSPVLKTRGDEIADNQTMSQMESLAAGAGSQVMMANIQAMERSIEERDESQTDHRVNITLWNLKQLGHFLAAVPGRKNVIWFSGSFPISVIPTEKNSTQPSADLLPRYYEEEVQKTSEILAAARVAIYPIDARGLRPSNFYDASIPPTNPGSNPSALQSASLYKEDLQRIAENASMDEIAIDTGGKAFYNTNGLEDAMVKVFDTGDHFYTITYTPRNRNMDGQFRKVNVKTNKGGYKLSYRHGYYAVDRDKALELPGNPVGGPLQTFMGLGMPNYDQIPFQMTIEPEAAHVVAAAAAKLSIQKYNVDLTVPSGGLTLALEPDGTHRGALKLGFAAYIRNGECMYRVWRLIDVTIPPESFQDFEQKGLQIHQLIDLPKGELWLRTGIYEPSSSRVGTLEVSMSTIAH
jgi:VWFA-related protein